MEIFYIKNDGKIAIKKAAAFCELNNSKLPAGDKLITDLIEEMDRNIRVIQSKSTNFKGLPIIKTGALANSHGDWYEWILAITALNIHLLNKTNYIALLLPNVSRFDVADLYKADIKEIISDLKGKVQSSAGVEFVSSNPDFVIIDMNELDVDLGFDKPLEVINEELIKKVENLYELFVNKCTYDDIIGYLSVKTSLRPDRRLQIAHEGSLMKAIYAHLQTRQWILEPKGLKYYAVSTVIGPSDRNALRTVATHSLITVNTIPQAAVDEVYEINSVDTAKEVFSIILNN